MATYYTLEVTHPGLNKYRLIRGTDPTVVEQKARAQVALWDEMWEKRQEIAGRRNRREGQAKEKEQKVAEARERTEEAQASVLECENLLKKALERKSYEVDWESLKDKSPFTAPAPKAPTRIPIPPRPSHPSKLDVPREPLATDPIYSPRFKFLDKLVPEFKARKIQLAEDAYKRDAESWKARVQELKKMAVSLLANYKTELSRWEKAAEHIDEANAKNAEAHQKAFVTWEMKREGFLAKQADQHTQVDKMKPEYMACSPAAVVDYCELVLARSDYPDTFPQEFDLDYIGDTKILILDYSLPGIEAMPRIKEVKYVQSRDEFQEVELSDGFINKFYDDVLCQVALRTMHELFMSDVPNAIQSIVFNGWVKWIDKAMGKEVNACILSLQAGKDEFLEINLLNVEPKACFKKLKGVGSAKLHSLSPVAPILKLDREDKRFVAAYAVVDGIDERSNLAAMDWEDFEHLIREVFEKEFSSAGGEVKITRASRDGGVDAVAFDPDPIRGGKIVIQAKRYTNTVGVSAVRDLYGTVMNEGATKGILVTTADYGPDAYEFVKDKPLTLLSGGNLLHLLEKHGHKAKIDLKEAKMILAEKERERAGQ